MKFKYLKCLIIKSSVCDQYSNYGIKWFDSKIAKLKYNYEIEQAVKYIKEHLEEEAFATFNPIRPSTACYLIIMADKDDSIYQSGWCQLDWI